MSRYIFPTLLILISMAIYAFYISPLYLAVQRNAVRDTDVKVALVEADTAQTQLDEITKRFESFPPDANITLSQIIPENVDPIRLLIETTAFLERNGFPSNSVRVSLDSGSNTKGAPYQTYSISFSISASYDTFREFLHTLESSLVLRDMSSVSFSASAASSGGSTRPELAIHQYFINVRGYSLH